MRTEDAIMVQNGQVLETGVLADSEGQVFIEFIKGTRVLREEDRTLFTGAILPPAIIGLPARSPRTRMEELLTFELLPDSGDALQFKDKFDVMTRRNRLRYEYMNPGAVLRTALVQLIMPIEGDIGSPKLWKFLSEEEGWMRIGGKIEESSTPDVRIFSSTLQETGVFAIFDEDPPPRFVLATPPEQIELAPPSPFPSIEVSAFDPEGSGPEREETAEPELLPEGEELLIEEPLFEEEGSPEIPAILEEEIPAIGQEAGTEIPATPEEELEGETPLAKAAPEETGLPEGGELPKTGPDETSSPASSKFPIILIFALGILGGSIFFASRKNPRI